MMVLFLLVMSVALLAVTKSVSELDHRRAERDNAISRLLDRVAAATRDSGVTVDRDRRVLDFRDRAHFDFDSSALRPDQARLLRRVVSKILTIARDPLGEKWFKRIDVEGFTDQKGNYLYNLNLSLNRSERVLCVLLDQGVSAAGMLDLRERRQVQQLFFVGGYSSNSAKASPVQSRRIELQLEFLAVGEHRDSAAVPSTVDAGRCSIGNGR